MNDNDREEIFEACGKAIGFALAASAQPGANLKTVGGVAAFTDALNELIDTESFSGDVGLVMMGVVDGIKAYAAAVPGETRKIV